MTDPDKRAQVLDGARRAFLAYGYARASTDRIAQAAGVSKATVYVYYPSKELLLAAVLREAFGALAPPSLPADLDTAADLRPVLVELATSLLGHMMTPSYIALLRVIVAEAPHAPELAQLFQRTIPAHAFRAVQHLLDQAQARGLLATSDFEAAARLFVGSLLTYTILDGLFVVDGPPQPPDQARIAALMELFLTAITQTAAG